MISHEYSIIGTVPGRYLILADLIDFSEAGVLIEGKRSSGDVDVVEWIYWLIG